MKPCNFYSHIFLSDLEDDAVLRDRFARHARVCPDCDAWFVEQEALFTALFALPEEEPGELFFKRQAKQIQQTIAAEKPTHLIRQRRVLFIWGAAAACVLMVLGLSRFRSLPFDMSPRRNAMVQAMHAIEQQSALRPMEAELDTLSGEELDHLALRLERHLLRREYDQEWIDDSIDWQDLEGQELDLFLQRLEHRGPRRSS